MQKSSLLQSVQGGPFNNNSRMIDIDIPTGYLVDMSQSFIQLETSIIPDSTTFTKGVSNLVVSNTLFPSIAPMNVDLFKNAYLSSSIKGKLEDLRRDNIFSRNLQEFTKSTSQKFSLVNSLTQYTPFSNLVQLSPYIEARKVGSVLSAYRSNFLRIPLSDLFQLGTLDSFDTSKFGTCRIHLELDNVNYYGLELKDNISPNETLGPTVATLPAGITTGYDIPMKQSYDCIEMIPFFVGQHVTINCKVYNGGNVTSSPTFDEVISKITYTSSTGLIVLTTGQDLTPATAGDSFNGFVVTAFTPAGGSPLGSFNILTAQLGLATIEGAPASASPNQIDYLTFTTEEYNAGDQPFMNKIFEIEPECVNVFLMQNDPEHPSNLLSVNTLLTSYRLRIDGNDVTDRDVNINLPTSNPYAVDPLHYELLNRTFLNAGFPLKSLESASFSRSDDEQSLRLKKAENQIVLICCPTPMTANTKKFQVNLATTDPAAKIKNVILFKQVLRSIKL